ncbi:MAG: hypothetical protein ACPIOQ_02665 [Promethearchaeia archaeon]
MPQASGATAAGPHARRAAIEAAARIRPENLLRLGLRQRVVSVAQDDALARTGCGAHLQIRASMQAR